MARVTQIDGIPNHQTIENGRTDILEEIYQKTVGASNSTRHMPQLSKLPQRSESGSPLRTPPKCVDSLGFKAGTLHLIGDCTI